MNSGRGELSATEIQVRKVKTLWSANLRSTSIQNKAVKGKYKPSDCTKPAPKLESLETSSGAPLNFSTSAPKSSHAHADKRSTKTLVMVWLWQKLQPNSRLLWRKIQRTRFREPVNHLPNLVMEVRNCLRPPAQQCNNKSRSRLAEGTF